MRPQTCTRWNVKERGSGHGASPSCEWGKSEGLKKETVMKGMFKED